MTWGQKLNEKRGGRHVVSLCDTGRSFQNHPANGPETDNIPGGSCTTYIAWQTNNPCAKKLSNAASQSGKKNKNTSGQKYFLTNTMSKMIGCDASLSWCCMGIRGFLSNRIRNEASARVQRVAKRTALQDFRVARSGVFFSRRTVQTKADVCRLQ